MLQFMKYNLEKKTQEQERQLCLWRNTKDGSLAQIQELEKKTRMFTQDVKKVMEVQERLELNVKEGIKINRQLSETNTNLREELGSKEAVIDGLRQELVETKASLSSQPQDVVEKISRLQHSVDSLEKELKSQEDMVKGLREQLAETVTEKNTLTSSLKEAHLLVDRHIQSNTSLSSQLTTAQADLEALRTQNDQLKADSEAKAGQMKEQEALHQEETEAWKKEETSLQERLSGLQKDYEVLSKAHGSLEELNTMWAGRNVDLTEEVERLKTSKLTPRSRVQWMSKLRS
ncbi:synaptonemal complex protein ZEP1-like [Lingula anatina]|uniref:Synaptonemal complex protein ZEP1-like n=1 Tax=Lingula anatina TaxID=7574 RepID=A0A1S3IT48_LINAN|nr:synaptonemal complex protein ZEP1-like [Lingula anatina]|eukprot:XP_013400709.1 synaptonemal complex protein ZEP1-like [Lingula anatina]